MVHFDQNFHTYYWQHSLTTGMTTFFDERGFAEHQSRLLWPVCLMLMTSTTETNF